MKQFIIHFWYLFLSEPTSIGRCQDCFPHVEKTSTLVLHIILLMTHQNVSNS